MLTSLVKEQSILIFSINIDASIRHFVLHMRPTYTRAISKVRGLPAVRRCYADEGGDCYAKL